MESVVQQRKPLETATILGVPIHRVRMDEALATIERFIAERTPHLVITADANAVLIALDDPEFHTLIQHADLVTPDGAGLLWAGRHCGQPFPERVSGVDLVWHLTRLSHERGYRLFFLGSAPGVAERARQNLLQQFPNAQIVGTVHGYFRPEEEPTLIQQIGEAQPDVLLVAMGMPRQEKWAHRHREVLRVPVMIGVGGSFDVYAGVVKRAPKWLQNSGLEWLWRLAQDPRKIRKVRNLPRFAWRVLTQAPKR
ncbi:MAG: WecB/TagA/CpsF family glycosyltransferase [Fimbriimonadales bacterium]